MRYSHSSSKPSPLDSCLRKYFFEYYASAKLLPFDANRKELIRGLKEFTGTSMLAGDRETDVLLQQRLAQDMRGIR